MIVVLTVSAERDLEAIGDHIARDDPARAAGFLHDLRAACLGLADMPARFPLLSRHATAGVRRRLHGDDLIFYRIEPEAVVILHVLHGARDHEAILFPD